MIIRRGSPVALGVWLLAAACSTPSTNFFDSLAAGGSSAAGTSSSAGASSIAGTSDDGEQAASGSAGLPDPDEAGSASTTGGGGEGSGMTSHGGLGGGSDSVGVGGDANSAGGNAGSAGKAGGSAGNAGTAGGSVGNAGDTGVAGGSGDPVVELEGNATASSWESDFGPGGGFHPPRYANDGDLTTRWCAEVKTLPQWWQLDLGATRALSRIEIVWEYPGQALGYTYGYEIGVSDSATQFPSLPAIDNNANQSTAKTQIASFAPQTAGRYVRVTVTSLPPDMVNPDFETWASIYEVRVFGH